jgi:hypothetical protein
MSYAMSGSVFGIRMGGKTDGGKAGITDFFSCSSISTAVWQLEQQPKQQRAAMQSEQQSPSIPNLPLADRRRRKAAMEGKIQASRPNQHPDFPRLVALVAAWRG